MVEETAWWRTPDPGQPELLRAAYRHRTFARHAHERFAVGVIEAGGLAFSYRGEHILAPAGWVNLAFPGEAHSGQPADARGWAYRMFYLDPAELTRMVQGLDPGIRELPFVPAGAVWDPDLARRIRALHRFCEDPQADPLDRQGRLVALVQDLVLRHGRVGAPPPVRKVRTAVDRARELLLASCGELVPLARLAEAAGMNPYRLVRCFTQEVGLPPHAFLVQARVRKAAGLLRRGATPAAAAAESGFTDQSHLNRHFLRHFGLTPGVYRRAFQAR